MHSVERYKEWIEEVPGEDDSGGDNKAAKEVLQSWPNRATIEFVDFTCGYNDGPDVLKQINFVINHQEKIGIVGRTGSGKRYCRIKSPCI